TEMKDPDAGSCKIQIISAPKGIGAASVKKSAPIMTLFSHDISIGSRSFGRHRQMANIDMMSAAVLNDLFAQGITPDQPGAMQWERDSRFRQILEHIVRRATCALRLIAYIPKLFGLRI